MLLKHKDMSLGDITHVRKVGCHPHTCNPSTEGWGQRMEEYWGLLAISLVPV